MHYRLTKYHITDDTIEECLFLINNKIGINVRSKKGRPLTIVKDIEYTKGRKMITKTLLANGAEE